MSVHSEKSGSTILGAKSRRNCRKARKTIETMALVKVGLDSAAIFGNIAVDCVCVAVVTVSNFLVRLCGIFTNHCASTRPSTPTNTPSKQCTLSPCPQ